MTKAEIVETIYERVGFSKKESAELVETVFDVIKDALVEGEKVKFSGFRQLHRPGEERAGRVGTPRQGPRSSSRRAGCSPSSPAWY